MKDKIQKILSKLGYGSRRKIEEKIIQKKILVNDNLAKLGQIISINEYLKIYIDGNLIPINNIIKSNQTICRVLLYNKKEGEICTLKDRKKRPTVFDNLPKLYNSRWISIGRLDINTSGLLLFTNDGELAHRLMHPSSNIERKYKVRVFGNITQYKLNQLQNGIKLDNILCSFKTIKFCHGNAMNKWFEVSLNTGKNHEVRRLLNSVDLQVNKLMRVRYGNIILPKNLQSGCFIKASENLLTDLKKSVMM